MILYVSGRQLGKTTQVVRWWLVDPGQRVIYCPNMERAKHVQRTALALVGDRWTAGQKRLIPMNIRVFPYNSDARHGVVAENYAIDDLEEVLSNFLGFIPDFITATGQIFGEQDHE